MYMNNEIEILERSAVCLEAKFEQIILPSILLFIYVV